MELKELIKSRLSGEIDKSGAGEDQIPIEYFYCLVGNIPENFHSSCLRNYFNEFIESDRFNMFHFRHRPQQINMSTTGPVPSTSTSLAIDLVKTESAEPTNTFRKKTLCSIVRFDNVEKLELFIRKYNGKFWMDTKGNDLGSRCLISKINPDPSDLIKFAKELRPPKRLMPKGNVGTCNNFFLNLIKTCQLPPSLINKLGLVFPRLRSFKRYSKVPFDYDTNIEDTSAVDDEEDDVTTARGHKINNIYIGTKTSENNPDEKEIDKEASDSDEDDDNDKDRCEEWERHESLHNNVGTKNISKEKLYEDEVELVWEKGGPGLVWWTDEQYWRQQENPSGFDEETADDLDVDMSIYYEKGGGDKDSRDLLQIRRSERFQKGIEDISVFANPSSSYRAQSIHDKKSKKDSGSSDKIGQFEKYSKGVGRKIMERQGWAEGKGIGKSTTGIKDALDASDGQNPHDKRGIGYYGEKLEMHNKNINPSTASSFSSKRKSRRKVDCFGTDEVDGSVVIGTIYDKPENLDQDEPPLRSNAPTFIKRYKPDSKLVLK